MVARAVRDTFRFAGRSSRTELLVYYLATIAAGFVIALPLILIDGNAAKDEIRLTAEWVIVLPMAALLVRRMHDHDRSGWWASIPIGLAVINGALGFIARDEGVAARIGIERALPFIGYLEGLAALATILLIVMPGTVGSNRFGPDPRGRS